MYDQSGQTAVDPAETDFGKMSILPASMTIRTAGVKGQGVFSAKPLAAGEVAIVGKPVSTSPDRTWQTLQMDIDSHVRMDVPFESVNHSCDPNCGVKTNKYNGYSLVAMRDIEAGEEITFDYCMTEWFIVGFESCHCNSDRCRKIIRGGKFLPSEKLKEYGGYTAPYYRSLLQKGVPV